MKSAALLRNPVRNVILTVFLLLGVKATNCAKKEINTNGTGPTVPALLLVILSSGFCRIIKFILMLVYHCSKSE